MRTTPDALWTLLIACARHSAGLCDVAEVRVAESAVADWDAAIAAAQAHGLLSLLARALLSGPSAPHHSALHHRARHSAEHALRQFGVLRRLAQAFAHEGIHVLPYKGPLLAHQLYGDIALRTSSDLDFAVAHNRFDAARRVLIAQGFRSRNAHSPRRERTLFSWVGQAPFVGPDGEIDLHWRFSPVQFPLQLTPESAYARGSDVRVGGSFLRAMALEDTVVALSAHAARHLYERLEWLVGVTVLLRRLQHDVDALLAYAAKAGARRAVVVSARVANLMLEMPLDDAWQRALAADPACERLAQEMAAAVPEYWRPLAPQVDGASLQFLYGRFLPSASERMAALIRGVVTPTERDWQAIPLPDSLLAAYSVIRPVRLSLAYASRLVRDTFSR